MAKVKLSLTPNPTFKATVHIPVPGNGTAPVEFVFKYRDRDAMQAFLEEIKGKEDADVIMAMASGWDLDDPFDADNVDKLTKKYLASTMSILDKYLQESTGQRQKN
jgi:hypothetical protein